jgi:hypothetical protein
MLIRVPVVLVGISEPIWGMDGMYETIVELRLSEAFEFSMLLIEKVRVWWLWGWFRSGHRTAGLGSTNEGMYSRNFHPPHRNSELYF